MEHQTGHMRWGATFVCDASPDSEESIILDSDCGIYNALFKRPVRNENGEVCGTLYIHAPNCTFENGKYLAHAADEDRTTIAYHQLCDLAKVPYDTQCYDLFKALGDVAYPDGYKPNPNRAERRRES